MKNLETRQKEARELLKSVRNLARQGLNQNQILGKLGFKNPFTLKNHLVKASQLAKIPIPQFGHQSGKDDNKKVEYSQVRRRGKGNAFGVNIPQEPLIRADMEVGDRVQIKVRGKTINISKVY